jgi:hypothetical protein
MNSKQETALRMIAQWAERFEYVESAVIYGSRSQNVCFSLLLYRN